MSDRDWHTVAAAGTEADAQIVLGLLQSEGIPARIKGNVPVPGLGLSFHVQVEAAFATRAAQVLGDAQINEDELTQLAVSSPGADSDQNL